MQERINIGDIFAQYGECYIGKHNIKGQQKGIIRLLASCRTAALGSHYEKCDNCGYKGKAYNSCRNRHCPTCQQKDKAQWLEKRMQELLPVGYYHIVFTIPHQLNNLCLKNKKVMYGILFKAASETILELARDVKHLGAETGLVTVLHTWGQNMMEHPHLHCIMPAGGLSFDKGHWVHTDKKGDFFVYYKVLSRKFRGKFLYLLQKAFDKGQLKFNSENGCPFNTFKDKLYKMDWVANIQKPFGSPEKVLEYLSRYVFRIAITNRRIIEIKDGKVFFSWKDYRSGHFRKMRLDIDEFIRRFLLHLLPEKFFKVRYYGILSSRHKAENLEKTKELLEQEKQDQESEELEDGKAVYPKQQSTWEGILKMIRQYAHQKPNCPKCKKGRLQFAGTVPPERFEPG